MKLGTAFLLLPSASSFISRNQRQPLHATRSTSVLPPFLLHASDVSATGADDIVGKTPIQQIVQTIDEDIGMFDRSPRKRGNNVNKLKKKNGFGNLNNNDEDDKDTGTVSTANSNVVVVSKDTTTPVTKPTLESSSTDEEIKIVVHENDPVKNGVLNKQLDNVVDTRDDETDELTDEDSNFNTMLEEIEALARDSVVQIDELLSQVSQKDHEIGRLSGERDSLNGAMNKLNILLDELETALVKSDEKIEELENDNENQVKQVKHISDTLFQVKADSEEEISKQKKEAADTRSKLEKTRDALQTMLDKALGEIVFAESATFEARQEAEQSVGQQKKESKKYEQKMRRLVADEKKIVKQQMWDLETKLKSVQYKLVVANNEVKKLKKIISQFDEKVADLEVTHAAQINELLARIDASEMFYSTNKATARKRLVGMVEKFQRRLKRREEKARNNMETLRTELKSEFDAEKNEIIASYEAKLSDLNIQADSHSQPITTETEEPSLGGEVHNDQKKEKQNMLDKMMKPIKGAWVSGAIVSLLGGLETSKSNNRANNASEGLHSHNDEEAITGDIAQLLHEAEQIVAEVDTLLESSSDGIEEIELNEKSPSELPENNIQTDKSLSEVEVATEEVAIVPNLSTVIESSEIVTLEDVKDTRASTAQSDERRHRSLLETRLRLQNNKKKDETMAEANQRSAEQSDEITQHNETAEVELQLLEERERMEEQQRMARDTWEAEETATRLEEEARRAEIEYLLEEARIAREAQEFEAELQAEEARYMEEEKLEQDMRFPKASSNKTANLIGKVVTQRSLYRFSPTEESVQSPFAIEEHQYFQVTEDESMELIGEKSIIIRGFDTVEESEESITKSGDKPHKYITVGPPLFSVNGLEDIPEDNNGSARESNYAVVLYCMSNPDIIQGTGMQLGSGAGIAGIMSVIGAGLATTLLENNDKMISDVKDGTPVTSAPEHLSKILLTDSRGGDVLDKCVKNLRACDFPSSKVELGLLDWSRKTPAKFIDKFDFILGSGCSSDLRNIKPLARTVAFSLKSSPFDSSQIKQKIRGKFVHIGKGKVKSFAGLEERLSKGYKMHSKLDEMVLERVNLVPLVAATLKDARTQLKNVDGPVEYGDIESSSYSALIAHHDQDYNGSNGDIVFQSGLFI